MTSLRNKLWLGFGSLLLILVVVSLLTVIVFTRYSHGMERVFHENYNSAIYCDAMKESLDQLNARAQRLIWQESAARNVDFAGAESRFEASLNSELGNCFLPGELDASRDLAGRWQLYREHYAEFNDNKADRAEKYDQDLRPRYEKMRQVTQHIEDMNMTNMVSVDGQAKRTLVAVRNSLIVLVVAGTALAGVVVWTISVSTLRPLRDLTESARQIETGNLDLNLALKSHDEIGSLAQAFNSMASHLREFKRIDHDRLMRTQQTTQLAIDSLIEAVFVIGPDDTIEISNEAAKMHFAIVPGRTISDLGLKWLGALYNEVKTHARPVEPHGYKSAIQVFVDGEERFLLPKAVPMLSPDQRLLGVTAILIDATQLRHVDEAKSSLVSTVSHELRTPLTSQRLLLGLLLTTVGPLLTATQRRMLEVAKADNDRLYRTIDDLLSISRIESGRAQFEFRALSPQELVYATVMQVGQLFADKNLRLMVSAPEELPAIRADSASMNSVLTNLLSNALKFTPSGGLVTVSAKSAGENILFSVTDSGPGIPVEFRSRVFDKFFRVPTSSGPSGAGLGLSISKNIVEAHGGHLELVCPDEGGTIFRFQIPVEHSYSIAGAVMAEQANPR